MIWEYSISERENNDKRYSRIKTLQDWKSYPLMTIKSNNKNSNGVDFGKDTIRSDGSFVMEAWKFWSIFNQIWAFKNVEIIDWAGKVKSHTKDRVWNIVEGE